MPIISKFQEKTKLIEQPMGIVEDVIPIPAVQETSTDDDEVTNRKNHKRLRKHAHAI